MSCYVTEVVQRIKGPHSPTADQLLAPVRLRMRAPPNPGQLRGSGCGASPPPLVTLRIFQTMSSHPLCDVFGYHNFYDLEFDELFLNFGVFFFFLTLYLYTWWWRGIMWNPHFVCKKNWMVEHLMKTDGGGRSNEEIGWSRNDLWFPATSPLCSFGTKSD